MFPICVVEFGHILVITEFTVYKKQ